MGPVSLVVSCTQKLTFPHCSLVVMGEKLGMDPRIEWPSCCRVCREPFFSGAVDLFKSVDDYMKGCPLMVRLVPTVYQQILGLVRATRS
jgi:hypothetical protein